MPQPAPATDFERWRRNAGERPRWDDRNAIIAGLVPPGASVLDLGAGARTLGGRLPEGCRYQPVDLVPGPGVVVCDFNRHEYPSFGEPFDVAVCSGVLEYLDDPEELLVRLPRLAHRSIVSYAAWRPWHRLEERTEAGWHNHLTPAGFEGLLARAGLAWRSVTTWHGQVIVAAHRQGRVPRPPLRELPPPGEPHDFRAGMEALWAFAALEGHADVPKDHVQDGVALADWVRRQREAWLAAVLPVPLVESLERVPGWAWRPREARWLRMQRALRRLAPNETPPRALAVWYEEQTRGRDEGRLHPSLVRLLGELEHPPAAPVNPGGKPAAHRKLAARALAAGRVGETREHLEKLEITGEPALQAAAASGRVELRLEERAAERGLLPDTRIALWWMRTPYPGNFGDVLNPYLVEKVTGLPPRFAPAEEALLAVGSVIKFARVGTTVWGTGTPRMTDPLDLQADYRAVRGPLTRELVLRSGGTCPEVYGDPTLLLPRYYRPPDLPPRHAVGLVRHLKHRDVPLRLDGVHEISVVRCGAADVERFVDELAECEVVLSSSLHGVITAQAYGIPARWCDFSALPGAIPGDGTKFEDYFRSVDLPIQRPLDLSGRAVLTEALAREVDLRVDLQFDAEALLAAFPR